MRAVELSKTLLSLFMLAACSAEDVSFSGKMQPQKNVQVASSNTKGAAPVPSIEPASAPVNVAGANLTDCAVFDNIRGNQLSGLSCSWKDSAGKLVEISKVNSVVLKESNGVAIPLLPKNTGASAIFNIDNIPLPQFSNGGVLSVTYEYNGVVAVSEIGLDRYKGAAILADALIPVNTALPTALPTAVPFTQTNIVSCTPESTDTTPCTSTTPYAFADKIRFSTLCNMSTSRGTVISMLDDAITAGSLCRADACLDFNTYETAIFNTCHM